MKETREGVQGEGAIRFSLDRGLADDGKRFVCAGRCSKPGKVYLFRVRWGVWGEEGGAVGRVARLADDGKRS